MTFFTRSGTVDEYDRKYSIMEFIHIDVTKLTGKFLSDHISAKKVGKELKPASMVIRYIKESDIV